MALRNVWANLIKNRDLQGSLNFIHTNTLYKITPFRTDTYTLKECVLLKKDYKSFHYVNTDGLVYETGILPGDHRYIWDIKDYTKFFK